MLILHFNRIPSANAWNEGPIYQDIMFSQNNVFYAPVILCKNKFNANEDFWKILFCGFMIMLESLNCNDIAYGLDGTFTSFVNS